MERINSVLSGVEIDESLAYGLEREMQQKKLLDENYRLFLIDGSSEKNQSVNTHYMSALKSASNISRLAWSGDVCLEGMDALSLKCSDYQLFFFCLFLTVVLVIIYTI